MVEKNMSIEDKTLIPEGWKHYTLGSIGKPKMCKRILKEQTTLLGEVPFFKIGTFGGEADAYISRKLYERYKKQYSFPQKGAVLLSASGTIGRTVVYDGKDAYFQDSNIVWIDNKEEIITNEYLYYCYQRVKWQTADGGTVSRLYNDLLKKTRILVPPICEQKAIVKAISDIDTLIFDLERLVDKKKDIMRGAMQDLLSGSRRIPGCKEAWDEYELVDLCYLITKQTGFDYSSYIKPSLVKNPMNGTLPFIQNKDFEGVDINYATDFYIPEIMANRFPKILLNEKCLLISISGRIGNVGIFPGNKVAFVGGAVGVAKFKDKSLVDWVMLYLRSNEGQKQIFAHEKVGAQHNLTVEDVRHIKIRMPSKSERDQIMRMFTDFENDIKSIEQKIKKYRNLKQGMMQKLLTGEIRLV